MINNKLNELLIEFGDDVKFDFDLKKKIGLILAENQRYFTKQMI